MLDSKLTRRSALGLMATATAALAACAREEPTQKAGIIPQDSSLPATERIPALLASMSTAQKVEQLIVPSLRYASYGGDGQAAGITELPSEAADAFVRHCFGGVLLYGENIQSNEQTVRLTDALQRANASQSNPGNIALLIATDQEGGYIHRLSNGCQMCGNMALGATHDEQSTRLAASLMGEELSALGINLNLAPDVDINSNPHNPIIGVRSFGDTPELVSSMGVAYVEGLHDQAVVACAKHFPGHGDTETDSHTSLPRIEASIDVLRERELVPFAQVATAGIDMIMTAHIELPSIDSTSVISKTGEQIFLPATLSQTLVRGVLRDELGFTGVVSTDSLVMDAIAQNFEPMDVARLALEASVDILLEPVDPGQSLSDYLHALDSYVSSLVQLVDNGTIPSQVVDDAVTRILTLKASRGLLGTQTQAVPLEQRIAHAHEVVGSQQHHEIEQQIALGAITLVQNNDALPLPEDTSALVLVPYESQVTAASYAVSLIPDAPPIEILCYDTVDDAGFAARYAEALATSGLVIIVSSTYEQKDLETTGTTFIDEVLEQCAAAGVRSAVISSQLPYDLGRYAQADALLACYYAAGMTVVPSTYNGEVAGWGPNLIAALLVTFGAASPGGSLPVSIERDGFALFDRDWGLEL